MPDRCLLYPLLDYADHAYGRGAGIRYTDSGRKALMTRRDELFGMIRYESNVPYLDFPCGTDSSVLKGVRGIFGSPESSDGTWASVVLDGSVPVDTLCRLLDTAFKAVVFKGSASERRAFAEESFGTLARDLRIRDRISGKVYSDTALDGFAAPDTEDVPERIRQMRALFTDDEYRTFSEPAIFVRMAFFMEDYEDDRPYTGSFPSPFQTYRMMGNAQLRGYFTWRTGVRRGELSKTYPSYAYTYACELINGVGWKDPEKGFAALKDLIDRYSELDPGAFPHGYTWLSDFAALYGVKEHGDLCRTLYEKACRVFTDIGGSSAGGVEEAVTVLSGKDYSSKLSKTCREDLWETVKRALDRYDRRFGKNGVPGLRGAVFRSDVSSYYHMFPTAVYYDPGPKPCRYSVKGVADYICTGGIWIRTTYAVSREGRRFLADIVRAADSILREKLGVRPPIACPLGEGNAACECVREAADGWLREKRARSVPKVDIDTSRLTLIRRDAESTMERIMTSEEREEPPADVRPPEEKRKGPEPSGDTVLSPDEREFLRCVLYGRPWKDLLRGRHIMLSVIVDSVNSKLYGRFGDTVLTDVPEAVEDYAEELKEMIQRTSRKEWHPPS